MATQSKRIKNPPRIFRFDEYGILYKKKKLEKEYNIIMLIVFTVALALAGYILLLPYINMAKIPDSPENPVDYKQTLALYSVITIIVIALAVTLFACLIFSKGKSVDNGDGIIYLKKEEQSYKVVENFSTTSNVSIVTAQTYETKEEVDEYGNPIIYAEELFDDEEDIFVNEVLSSQILKEKERTYKEIIDAVDHNLLLYGLKGEIGKAFLSSMVYSPMIYAKSIRNYIPRLFKAFNNPNFVIHYSMGGNIASEKILYNAFEYAKANAETPVFIYIDQIPCREFLNYMRPLYAYIDNPGDDYYISSNGLTFYIPHNVYFLVDTTDNEIIYDISRRYLRYIPVLNCDIQEVEASPEAKPLPLSLKDLKNAKKNAHDQFSLSEVTYKKLDNLFALTREANGYVLQNKIQRKIEEYSSLLLSLGYSEDDTLDDLLSNAIIRAAIISTQPQKLATDFNIVRLIEDEFGADKMKSTKAVIKEYISLFDKNGGRTDA